MKTIVTIVGARPQFIKAAPVSRALKAAGISETMVHTGQHFDHIMSDVFFEELGIAKPARHLEINSLSHGAMTGRMLEAIEEVLKSERPDMVLVFGDTNSTIAGALAAAKLHIPVAHVEAGLRSFNKRMPEELNRIMTDHLSTLLFCPTTTAHDHLAKEGITDGVHTTGDVMYDITLQSTERALAGSRILQTLDIEPKAYAVATLHRQENTDDPQRFAQLADWLQEAARERPIIMPTHPRTQAVLKRSGQTLDGVRLVEPLGYLDMTMLLHHAAGVFTDSGGLQKEAYFHRVPCVTLRDETEWEETITHGWNRLWQGGAYRERSDIHDYGDGTAGEMIVKLIDEAIS